MNTCEWCKGTRGVRGVHVHLNTWMRLCAKCPVDEIRGHVIDMYEAAGAVAQEAEYEARHPDGPMESTP